MIPRSASNAAWLVPGSTLDWYELLLPIAEGGMAMLWLARQRGKHGFDRVVAIKTILPKLAAEPGFRQMFLDEARVASRIEHVHVAQVLDLGEENGVLFMAMEWVDSESLINLGRSVARSAAGAVPVGILARVMADACAGLHAAHELKDDEGRLLNVVHRDISPHNLLISYRGIAKVIDFGIAKARNRLAHDTNVGTVKGKIAYMAPEQAMGQEIDRRADVWGAGATLYRYLAGRAPFSAANPVATLRLLTSGEPPPPLPPGVSPPMRAVVEKALELEPEKRFRTMEEMRLALEEVLRANEARTSHSDVEAFMSDHLGQTRLTREAEITKALRESRLRTRATMRRAPSPGEIAQSSRTERPPPNRSESEIPSANDTPTVRPPPQAAPPIRRAPSMAALLDAPTRPSAGSERAGTPARIEVAPSSVDVDFDKRSTTRMRPQPERVSHVDVRMREGEFPAVRQPLLTPASLQVAPLSLRTSAPAQVDSDRSSAAILMRPPTPAWIRLQPDLASHGSMPVDAALTPSEAPPVPEAPAPKRTRMSSLPVPLLVLARRATPSRIAWVRGLAVAGAFAGFVALLRAAAPPPSPDANAAASSGPAPPPASAPAARDADPLD